MAKSSDKFLDDELLSQKMCACPFMALSNAFNQEAPVYWMDSACFFTIFAHQFVLSPESLELDFIILAV